MGRLRSMPLQRYESSGNLDSGDSNDIFNIIYNGNTDTDELQSANKATQSNDESVTTNKPVIIYQYETTLIWAGGAGAIWQYFGDNDDHAQMNVWDMSSSSFQEGLKNKMFVGSQGFDPYFEPPRHVGNFKVYKLKFKARKNPKRLASRYGKWAIKPIIIGPHTKDTFGFSLVNLRTGTESTSVENVRYYAHVELKRWQTEF